MQNHLLPIYHEKKGFTFVEMVIVGVIMAIISAVAIPIYTSHITKKRSEVVNQLAQTASVSANSYYRRTGTKPTQLDQLNLFFPQANRFKVDIYSCHIVVTDTAANPNVVSDWAYYY